MKVLGIDTSCDETSVAVITYDPATGGAEILSNIVSSQIPLHAQFGGVVPEVASRAHIERIAPVTDEALSRAGIEAESLDAVAVTCGPGLVGALLVGVNFAKGLAYQRNLPLIPVHHIKGHLLSPFISEGNISFPALSLVVSGGHTSLYLMSSLREFRRIGSTRDDAVGEAYDKVAKLLGLGYPGGPVIEALAKEGDPDFVPLPRLPKIGREKNFDFSYSGLKSAVVRYVTNNRIPPVRRRGGQSPLEDASQREDIKNICASFQSAAIEALRRTVRKAAKHFRQDGQVKPASITVSGGVSVNQFLQSEFRALSAELSLPVYFPARALTTDNGAMIAYCGAIDFDKRLTRKSALSLNADAEWVF